MLREQARMSVTKMMKMKMKRSLKTARIVVFEIILAQGKKQYAKAAQCRFKRRLKSGHW
jgi:hypothetical protein